MFGIELNLGRSGSAEPVPLSRFIGLERPRSRDGPDEAIFPCSLVALEHLRSDFERRIEKDRHPPFPRRLLLDRLPPSFPVVADRSGSFLETVFGFLVAVSPSFPVVAVGGGFSGRVWEGATAPLPIERAVSEANSFWGVRSR